MADQANLFDNGNPNPQSDVVDPQLQTQQPVQQPTQQPQLAPEVSALVGEGRKYANIESALASIPHAQQHIATLEADLATKTTRIAELEAQLSKASNLEDVLARISSNQQPASAQPIPSGLDEQAVLKLLEQRELQRIAQENQVNVTNALIGKFGDSDKAVNALKAKAAELGVGFDFMKDLAAKSPKAVLSYFNVDAKPSTVIPNTTQTTTQFQSPSEPQLTYTVGSTGSTTDLVNAFKACGVAVNDGQPINHNY